MQPLFIASFNGHHEPQGGLMPPTPDVFATRKDSFREAMQEMAPFRLTITAPSNLAWRLLAASGSSPEPFVKCPE